MEPREHQSKCQRGWEKLSLQFWGERPNWLKKPRRSMKHWNSHFSTGQVKREDLLNQNTGDFSEHHTHTHRHKIQTFQLHYLGYAVYVVDKWCLIFFFFFLSYEEEESFSFLLYNRSIFRDHDFK